MKKVGILNFQYSSHNYGAVLQAAALEHICRQLGHEAQHLDYMAKPKVSLKGRVGQLLRMFGLGQRPKANHVADEGVFEAFTDSEEEGRALERIGSIKKGKKISAKATARRMLGDRSVKVIKKAMGK